MRAGIALGSNVGDRLRNLHAARTRVMAIQGLGRPVKISRIYETEPVGCEPGSAPFLNAVMEVGWSGRTSDGLLLAVRGVERAMGRPERYPRNAPRVIDVDLLYISDLVLNTDELTLPHPRMFERRFVLAPLADICPDLLLPGQSETVAQLLAKLPDEPRVLPTDFSF
jgi:2-amino-4-hydroxy-6-hydroxymethyldihydropteridine diphosphokinase